MLRIRNILFWGLLFGLLLSACNGIGLQPEKVSEQERLPVDFPESYSLYAEDEALSVNGMADFWWERWQNPELNRLMQLALTENFSVLTALSRIEQARFKALKAESWLYPELGGGAGVGTQKLKQKNRDSISTDEWSLGLNASYEVDLWGRVRAVRTSEKEKFFATKEDLKTARLSVSGALAETWVNLIENRRHQDLLEQQIALQKKLLQIIILRFPLAKATALDIYQQQQLVEKLQGTLIPVVNNQEILRRRLALLCGRTKLDASLVQNRYFPDVNELPELGLPADLLAARPDIRAAGLRLKATEWEVVAARADRLPALRLTASGSAFGDDAGSILDNWLYNLAANLAGPIFDGGRRRAEVERVRAVVDERLQNYREVVVNAVIEVEDALTLEKDAAESLVSFQKQSELAKKTLREARRRYLNGSGDFLNVLKEELNSLQLDHDIITQESKILSARINLYIALGGSKPNPDDTEKVLN
ncbi:MAG: RND transporter [Deltaproteobacteria bacterium]|nr:MAG: RND transporter [Deltaproteobacteria bacterium]